MDKANKVVNIFLKLFGEDNIEVLNTYQSNKKIIVEFVLFKEIFFTSTIDEDIENKDILESQIKSQYNNACTRLKDLLLKIDRFFINEIM